MSVQTVPDTTPTRRVRAARVVVAAAKGGLIGTVAALAAWLLAGALAATAWVVLIVATIAAAAVLLWRGSMATWVWLALAIALGRRPARARGRAGERRRVGGARRLAGRDRRRPPRGHLNAGRCRCSPIRSLSVAIVVLAGEDLLDPWGSSWLWVPAVLGPVIGAADAAVEAWTAPASP